MAATTGRGHNRRTAGSPGAAVDPRDERRVGLHHRAQPSPAEPGRAGEGPVGQVGAVEPAQVAGLSAHRAGGHARAPSSRTHSSHSQTVPSANSSTP